MISRQQHEADRTDRYGPTPDCLLPRRQSARWAIHESHWHRLLRTPFLAITISSPAAALSTSAESRVFASYRLTNCARHRLDQAMGSRRTNYQPFVPNPPPRCPSISSPSISCDSANAVTCRRCFCPGSCGSLAPCTVLFDCARARRGGIQMRRNTAALVMLAGSCRRCRAWIGQLCRTGRHRHGAAGAFVRPWSAAGSGAARVGRAPGARPVSRPACATPGLQ
jgi:hypothetical protein